MQEWLARRNLLGMLQRQERPDAPTTVKNDHWVYYALKPVAQSQGSLDVTGSTWKQAFHGTWWYALWNLLLTRQIAASDDRAKGHEFNSLGAMVYCTPIFDTAIWYARAHNVFGDGVYHRVVLELRVEWRAKYSSKKTGGNQWTFPSDAVVIVGVWFCHNCGNPKGTEHVRFWEGADEAVPVGCQEALRIVSQCPHSFTYLMSHPSYLHSQSLNFTHSFTLTHLRPLSHSRTFAHSQARSVTQQ